MALINLVRRLAVYAVAGLVTAGGAAAADRPEDAPVECSHIADYVKEASLTRHSADRPTIPPGALEEVLRRAPVLRSNALSGSSFREGVGSKTYGTLRIDGNKEIAMAAVVPFPLELNDVSVWAQRCSDEVIRLPVQYVSPKQVNFITPGQPNTGVGCDTHYDIWLLERHGQKFLKSNRMEMKVLPRADAAFRFSTGTPVLTNLLGQYVNTFNPVRTYLAADDKRLGITVWSAGNNSHATTTPLGSATRNALSVTPPNITVGGKSVEVSYSGAAPPWVGLDQNNLNLISLIGLPTGMYRMSIAVGEHEDVTYIPLLGRETEFAAGAFTLISHPLNPNPTTPELEYILEKDGQRIKGMTKGQAFIEEIPWREGEEVNVKIRDPTGMYSGIKTTLPVTNGQIAMRETLWQIVRSGEKQRLDIGIIEQSMTLAQAFLIEDSAALGLSTADFLRFTNLLWPIDNHGAVHAEIGSRIWKEYPIQVLKSDLENAAKGRTVIRDRTGQKYYAVENEIYEYIIKNVRTSTGVQLFKIVDDENFDESHTYLRIFQINAEQSIGTRISPQPIWGDTERPPIEWSSITLPDYQGLGWSALSAGHLFLHELGHALGFNWHPRVGLMGEDEQRSRLFFDGHLTVQMQWALDQLISKPNMTPAGYFVVHPQATGLSVPDASHASEEQIGNNPAAIGPKAPAPEGSPQAYRRSPGGIYIPDHEVVGATPAPVVGVERAKVVGVELYRPPVVGVKFHDPNPSQSAEGNAKVLGTVPLRNGNIQAIYQADDMPGQKPIREFKKEGKQRIYQPLAA